MVKQQNLGKESERSLERQCYFIVLIQKRCLYNFSLHLKSGNYAKITKMHWIFTEEHMSEM